MEGIFHISNIFSSVLCSSWVDLHILEYTFCWYAVIEVVFDGGWFDLSTIRHTNVKKHIMLIYSCLNYPLLRSSSTEVIFQTFRFFKTVFSSTTIKHIHSGLSRVISDCNILPKKNQQGTNYVCDISQRRLFTNNNLFDQNVLDRKQ